MLAGAEGVGRNATERRKMYCARNADVCTNISIVGEERPAKVYDASILEWQYESAIFRIVKLSDIPG